MSDSQATDVAGLTERVAELTTRVTDLEEQLRRWHTPDEVPDDVVLAIAAACAAYLGKRATVRQVRLRSGSTWGVQGRTSIQQSHRFSRHSR